MLLALSGDISLNQCLLNIRSIKNKSASFLEFVKDSNTDLIAVTETWLRPEDTEGFISSITPPGYKFTHVPRNVKNRGVLGFFIKEDLSFEEVSKNNFQAKDVIFRVLYRAYSSKVLLYQTVKTFSLLILIFIWINTTPGP